VDGEGNRRRDTTTDQRRVETPQQEEEDPGISLIGSIALGSTSITVTNEDYYGWSNIKMILQSGILGYYEAQYSYLDSGAWIEIPLTEFTSGGKRFNPYERVPEVVTLSADTPSGRGTLGFKYN